MVSLSFDDVLWRKQDEQKSREDVYRFERTASGTVTDVM